MKRTDIRAGVVYAVKSSYGPPAPIVFLEDGAAGLYSRGNFGRGGIRKLEENSYTKAKRGRGFSDATRGYAAVSRNGGAGAPYAEVAAAMRELDPAAELARFVADEHPSSEILYFSIEPSLNQITGPYDEALAAYEAQQQAEREQRDRKAAAEATTRQRADSIRATLAEVGIRSSYSDDAFGDFIRLRLDEAEKLLALLAAKDA